MNKKEFMKSQTVRYVGVGLAGAILAGGITAGIMHKPSGEIVSVSEMGAKATSPDIWHSLNTLPNGWKATVTSMEMKDNLTYHQAEVYAANENNTCVFTVNKSSLPKHEFSGVSVDYLTQQRVLSYGESREAIDAVLATTPVKTTAGEVPFWSTTFTLNSDIDGDGKKDKMKETRLAHGYAELVDSDGNIPVTEITYSCSKVDEWSSEQLATLLEGLELNITGEAAPAIPSLEAPNPDNGAILDEAEVPELNAEDKEKQEKAEKKADEEQKNEK